MKEKSKPQTRPVKPPIATRRQALQRELKRWLPLLIDNLQPEKILLFGSMAADKHLNEWSDIDLVIVHQTSLSFYRRIKQVLQLLHPQVGVDLLIYTPDEFAKLSQERRFFRDEILDTGKVLYARG